MHSAVKEHILTKMNSSVCLCIFLIIASLNQAFCSQTDNTFAPDAENDVSLGISQAEREWLEEHPVIRLGLDGNYPPYFFRDDEGRYQGIAVEYAEYIEKKLGIILELVAVQGNVKVNWVGQIVVMCRK